MNRVTSFFVFCSGADQKLLNECPTEINKYVGMGATVFFTGVFAALASGYALYTVFDSVWLAIPFGIIWGVMIFNLDRYIVSSMRKSGRAWGELMMATPRIILALIIAIVIAKPLELKIFEKEISPELSIMEQEVFLRQEDQVRSRFVARQDSLKTERGTLYSMLQDKTQKRDELVRIAREEADGTGGSKKKNLGPIYKVKKADADKAETELLALTEMVTTRVREIDGELASLESYIQKENSALERTRLNGPAARMEALDRITQKSSAIWWANIFILLLFMAIETAPVLVKLISARGPYDNLLRVVEHKFHAQEIEEVGGVNSTIKERAGKLSAHERNFINEKLDSSLKQF